MPIRGFKNKVCGVCGITDKDIDMVSSASIFANMRPVQKTTQTVSIVNFRKNTNSSRVVSLF